VLAYNDDGPDGFNAFISIELSADEYYFIFAGFYSGNSGYYDLIVQKG